jgi:hypothetical protein
MDDLSPDSKPAFLDPERASSIGYIGADEVPKFDAELELENPEAPSRGIIDRYREIARRHAHGQTNNQICAALGYTATRMSIILKDPFVQTEIQKWRQQFFDADAIERLKLAARDGAKRIHDIILNPKTEDRIVLQAAQFAVEKSHGKAKQEVGIESGTLMSFMELMKDMRTGPREVSEALPVLAVSASEDAPPQDKFDSWLDTNLK